MNTGYKRNLVPLGEKDLHVCLEAVADYSLMGISGRLGQTGSSVHPEQWSNNPEYTAATTKKRPCSYTAAYLHRPTDWVSDHGGHRLHKPRYDAYKNKEMLLTLVEFFLLQAY